MKLFTPKNASIFMNRRQIAFIAHLLFVITSVLHAEELTKIILPLRASGPLGENAAFVVLPRYMAQLAYPESDQIDRFLRYTFGKSVAVNDDNSALNETEKDLREHITGRLWEYYLTAKQVTDTPENRQYVRDVVWAENVGYVMITAAKNINDIKFLMRFESPTKSTPLTMQPYLSKFGINSQTPIAPAKGVISNKMWFGTFEENYVLGFARFDHESAKPAFKSAAGAIINLVHTSTVNDYMPLGWALAEIFHLSKFSGMTYDVPPDNPNLRAVFEAYFKLNIEQGLYPKELATSLVDKNGSVNWSRVGLTFDQFYTESHSNAAAAFQKRSGVTFIGESPLLDLKTGNILDKKTKVQTGEISRQKYVDVFSEGMLARPGAKAIESTSLTIDTSLIYLIGTSCFLVMDGSHKKAEIPRQ